MHRQTHTLKHRGDNYRQQQPAAQFAACFRKMQTQEKEGTKSKIVDAHNTKRRTAKLCAHEKSYRYTHIHDFNVAMPIDPASAAFSLFYFVLFVFRIYRFI